MNEVQREEFAKNFMEVFETQGDVRQMLLEWICRCPNIKTET